VRRVLEHWKMDSDLASVRDRDAIQKLPVGERRAWEALWKEVDALLGSVASPGPAALKSSGATSVRQGEAPADARPSSPPSESPAPAIAKPVDAEALDHIHRRAHELAQSSPAEAEALFRQALEGFREIQGPDGALTLDLTLDLATLLYQSGRGADAEPLFCAALWHYRQRFGPVDPRTAAILSPLGLSLIQQGKWSEAEPVLRLCLAIREKIQPDDWATFNTRSLLGGSLLGQKRYADAEPLIVAGYEGMKAREARIPPPGRPRFAEGADRVVRLYEEWGKKEKAAEWRARVGKPSSAAGSRP
jgi:hypothetical protein